MRIKDLPSFEQYCLEQGFELTRSQIEVWECWTEKRRFAVSLRRIGWATLLRLMTEYEELVRLTIENSSRKKRISSKDRVVRGERASSSDSVGRSQVKGKRSKTVLKGQKK